jgi:hypothetical protein
MTHRLILTAALLFAGNAALAFTTDSVVNDLSQQGYTRIEVRNGLTQTKVEAIRGTQKLEVVYDRATGAVLKSETEAVEADDDTAPGISIRNRNRDFVRVSSSDDSDDDSKRGKRSDDDDDDDSRDWSDDGDDDSRGRDDDDDRSDDDGSDDDRGDDDRGDDDRGDRGESGGDKDRGDSDRGDSGGDDD